MPKSKLVVELAHLEWIIDWNDTGPYTAIGRRVKVREGKKWRNLGVACHVGYYWRFKPFTWCDIPNKRFQTLEQLRRYVEHQPDCNVIGKGANKFSATVKDGIR